MIISIYITNTMPGSSIVRLTLYVFNMIPKEAPGSYGRNEV